LVFDVSEVPNWKTLENVPLTPFVNHISIEIEVELPRTFGGSCT
jgi:hypothetical protein